MDEPWKKGFSSRRRRAKRTRYDSWSYVMVSEDRIIDDDQIPLDDQLHRWQVKKAVEESLKEDFHVQRRKVLKYLRDGGKEGSGMSSIPSDWVIIPQLPNEEVDNPAIIAVQYSFPLDFEVPNQHRSF